MCDCGPQTELLCLLAQEFQQLYDMPNPYSQKPGAGGPDAARRGSGESSRPKQVSLLAPTLPGNMLDIRVKACSCCGLEE